MFKPKSPPPPPPVPPKITYRVWKKGLGTDLVLADDYGTRDGVLSFFLRGKLVRAYAPQMWLMVEPD